MNKYTSSRWVDDNDVVGLPRVRNWRNYDPGVDTGAEPCDTETLPEHATVPNMTLSMQQILERHRRGVLLPSNGAFFDEQLPDFGKMNKFDVIDAARANAEFIDQHQKGVKADQEKKKREKEAADAAEIQRLKAFEAAHSVSDHSVSDNK